MTQKMKNMRVNAKERLRAAITAKTWCSPSSAASAPPRHGPRARVRRQRDPLALEEGRMTVCNMAIEAGARAGMIGVDETTIAYLRAAVRSQGRAVGKGRCLLAPLKSDPTRSSTARSSRCARDQAACDLGHFAGDGGGDDTVPDPDKEKDSSRREGMERALQYWGSSHARRLTDIRIDKCSSARAPTRASRTCVLRLRWSREAHRIEREDGAGVPCSAW